MTTLVELARKLGITEHAAFVAAGLLIQRSAYWEVITDATTGELTTEAVQAITRYVAARTNEVTLEEPLTPAYSTKAPLGDARHTSHRGEPGRTRSGCRGRGPHAR